MLKQFPRFAVLVMSLWICAVSSSMAENTQWWQLTLSYSPEAVTVISAKPFKTPRKKVRTPGLEGAPLQLSYNVTWTDGRRRNIYETTTTLPVGIRATIDTPGNTQAIIPESGIIVIRVKGPQAIESPTQLRMQRTTSRQRGVVLDDAPVSLKNNNLLLTIPPVTADLSPPPGPVSATKVRDTGSDGNRLVIAVLGDGYTTADLGTGSFSLATTNLLTAFTNKSPYDIYFNATNVYRIDVVSNQSGSDEPLPGPGTYKDTYLNSSFWTNGLDRLLAINYTGQLRAIDAADDTIGVGVWDDLFVLVNSTRYGGSGGFISVASVNAQSKEIIIHEFGHTFAGLADEYTYGSSYPPANDIEPNVDFQYQRAQLKWNYWVEESTPLPTPAGSGYSNKVGAFEGAKYSASGIYRPWDNCIMRALGQQFCPVCKEATVLAYTNSLDLIDSRLPPESDAVIIGPSGSDFSVTPLQIAPLTYEWSLSGTPISGETSSGLTLNSAQLGGTTKTLTAKINHPTTFVRKTQINESTSWVVAPAPAGVDAEIWMRY